MLRIGFAPAVGLLRRKAAIVLTLGVAAAGCAAVEPVERAGAPTPVLIDPTVDPDFDAAESQAGDEQVDTADAGELGEIPEARRAMLPQFRNQDDDEGCDVEMATVWRETDRGVYAAEVRSRGDDCATATVSIALRGPTMRVLWRENFLTEDLAGFQAAVDARSMRSVLVRWITSGGSTRQTARQLPPWPNLDARRFAVDEEINQAEYESVRRADVPIFCYVAGLDRRRCVALVDEGRDVVTMGFQLFGEAG